MAAEWIRAQVFFASMYSYRVPNTSPSFAPASPVPSPSAVRLALVDAAIQQRGSLDDGQEIFDLVKAAPLDLVPPERVCVVRAFVKRLKPREGQLLESTGIREYCHPQGPLEIYLQAERETQRIAALFPLLRRLGTTDSLARCVAGIAGEPPASIAARRLKEVPSHLGNFERRMVVHLYELPREATLEAVNPYTPPQRGFDYTKDFWVLPLVQRQRGENWTLYERVPFVLSDSP